MESLPVLIKSNHKTLELLCDVASTPQEIAQGLMGRRYLSEHDGMVFLFKEPVSTGFWMLNTFVPLSIAFFDENGRILDIQDMEPLTLDGHSPGSPFNGALEMNKGWFEKHEVKVGDTITLPQQSHPLMLNETIYYGNDVGKVSHEGLVVTSEDDSSILPWDEVDEELVEKIYPRSLIKDGNFKSSAKNIRVPQRSLNLEDSPGLAQFINDHGINTFHQINEQAKRQFGSSYDDIVDRLYAFDTDLADLWEPAQITRASNWYPDEPGKVLKIGDNLGYSRETTSAVTARMSPSTAWLDLPSKLHSGNRDEAINLLGTVRQLADTGIKLDQPVKNKKGTIIIPKGTVDLSLEPEQIAMLPNLTASKKTINSFRAKAAELAKGDLIGEPVDFVEQTIRRQLKKRKKPVSPEMAARIAKNQAPKMMSFRSTIWDNDTDEFVADRHAVDLGMGGPYYGRPDFSAWFKTSIDLHPVVYNFFGAAYKDARHRARLSRPIANPSSNPISMFQGRLWNGHLGINKKGSKRRQTMAFVSSPNDRLFHEIVHEPDDSRCLIPQMHDYINLQ